MRNLTQVVLDKNVYCYFLGEIIDSQRVRRQLKFPTPNAVRTFLLLDLLYHYISQPSMRLGNGTLQLHVSTYSTYLLLPMLCMVNRVHPECRVVNMYIAVGWLTA